MQRSDAKAPRKIGLNDRGQTAGHVAKWIRQSCFVPYSDTERGFGFPILRPLREDADQIEHEYLVEVSGEIAPYGLARLRHGLAYGGRELPPCKVSWQNETRLRFAIKGVRNGQLRDVCAQVGLDVVSIRRLRIGQVALGKGPEGAMPPGHWRYLPTGEKF